MTEGRILASGAVPDGRFTGDDRGAWMTDLYAKLVADSAFAGVVYFSTDDATSKYALVESVNPTVKRAGYDTEPPERVMVTRPVSSG